MEKKMKKLLSLTFTALLAVLTLPLSAFDIVVNKEAKAVIIQGNRSMLCDMAVKNFHTAILKCTGVNLKILPAKDINKVPTNLNRIIIGDCKYAASKGFIGKNLRLEEYQLKVSGKDLFITGHDRIAPEVTPRGGPQPKHDTMDFRQYSPAVLWAVNELLDFQMMFSIIDICLLNDLFINNGSMCSFVIFRTLSSALIKFIFCSISSNPCLEHSFFNTL